MFNILFIQETPSSFSVFDEVIRTTSALEGFNSQLGRTFQHHGNFYKFLDSLLDMEKVQVHDMLYLVNGGIPNVRKTTKSENIVICTKQLKIGQITPDEFLNKLTSKVNNTIHSMSNFPENENADSCESDSSYEEPAIPTSANLCVICYTNQPRVLFIPCLHLKTCAECTKKLEPLEGSNNPRCPYCNLPSTQHHFAYV